MLQFLVMFRSRFGEVFPPKLAGFGPQDIERGVVEPVPSPQVEGLLCALLALVLNRKKPIESVFNESMKTVKILTIVGEDTTVELSKKLSRHRGHNGHERGTASILWREVEHSIR